MADTLEARVLFAKQSGKERELLLTEYRPFIISAVLSVCPTGGDAVFQTGFIAFTQAIELYEKEKGSFLSLAKTVIKRKVVDFIRKEKGIRDEVVFDRCRRKLKMQYRWHPHRCIVSTWRIKKDERKSSF